MQLPDQSFAAAFHILDRSREENEEQQDVLKLLTISWVDANHLNPLLPNVLQRERLAKILILIKENIIKQISYERRDYESVDEKILS